MKLSNIYLIKWYGPFSTKEEIKEWEDSHLPIRFNLHAFQAKQKEIQELVDGGFLKIFHKRIIPTYEGMMTLDQIILKLI